MRLVTEGFEMGALGRGYVHNSANWEAGRLRMLSVNAWCRWYLNEEKQEGYARWWQNGGLYNGTTFETSDGTGFFTVARLHLEPYFGILLGSDSTDKSFLLQRGTTIINENQWVVVEVHWIIGQQGLIEVRLNGNPELSWTGDNRILNFYGRNVGAVRLRGVSGYYDDLAINDTLGEEDNSWCGAGKVYYIPVSSDHQSSWLPSSGTNNFSRLTQIPHDSDTSYVSTSVIESKDIYNLSNFPVAMEGRRIFRLWPEAVGRKLEPEPGLAIQLNLNVNNTILEGSPVLTNVSYDTARIAGNISKKNPNTNQNWNYPELSNIKIELVSKQVEIPE